jgi:polysaccharide export outer membrane protein
MRVRITPMKRRYLTILSLLFFASLSAQSIEESFLKSLPAGIQDSMIEDYDSGTQEKTYNQKPQTRINNLESKLLEIKRDLNDFESQINREIDQDTSVLADFGYNFFDSYQTSFSAILEQNPSETYILGYEDVLSIQFTGKINKMLKAKVQRDGSVNIANVGQIFIGGLELQEAINLIKTTVSNTQLGVQSYVSLESIRDINIFLAGEVENPGFYTLPGGSNVLSLLHAAGGVKKTGSLRNIKHKRANITIADVDLYELLIFGNTNNFKMLRNGDVILVGPKGLSAAISGSVGHSAIYEMIEGEGFEDLINFSHGFSNHASISDIKLLRANGEESAISLSDLFKQPLNNGDNVLVYGFDPSAVGIISVDISGQVKKPGTYNLKSGTKLSELINLAGGYKEYAYPLAGRLYRESAKELEKKFFERSYNELISYLASNSTGSGGPSASFGGIGESTIQITLSELKNISPSGRVAAEFRLSKIGDQPELDTILLDGDEITIPEFSQEIYMMGQVMNVGALSHKNEFTASDYIELSGGLGKYADEDRIIVIFPNGDSKRIALNERKFFKEKIFLDPGTIIYAPRDVGKVEGINYAATIAPIISSIALSIASLNSINN